MPITLTNISESPVELLDTPYGVLAPAASIEIPNNVVSRSNLTRSTALKNAIHAGTVTCVATLDTGDEGSNSLVIPQTGTAYVGKESKPVVTCLTSGYTSLKPANPTDADQLFSPVTRLHYYYDATRSAWLSLSIFDTNFRKQGALQAGQYMPLMGVSDELGIKTPLSAHAVNIICITSIDGADSEVVFGFYKNDTQVYTFTKPAGQFNAFDLGCSFAIDTTLTTERGYRCKIESVSGQSPTDLILNLAFRLKL